MVDNGFEWTMAAFQIVAFMSDRLKFLVALIVILALALPRRYFAIFTGLLAIPVVYLVITDLNYVRNVDYGVDYTFARFAMYSALTIVGLVVALRLAGIALSVLWRWRPAFTGAAMKTAPRPSTMTRIRFFCVGGIVALVAFLALQSLLPGIGPAWIAHLIAFAAIASLWVAPRLLSMPPPDSFVTGVFKGFRGLFTILVATAVAMPILVAKQARDIAGDAPYCIQVADGREVHGDHKAAGTLLDMSGLTMRAKPLIGGGPQHAHLIVDEGHERWVYRWSYSKQDFVDRFAYDSDAPTFWPYLVCAPDTNFIGRLPLVFAENSDTIYVGFPGHAYRIPLTYRPLTYGGARMDMILRATPPHFRPNDGPAEPQDRSVNSGRAVSISLKTDGHVLSSWLPPPGENEEGYEAEEKFGLTMGKLAPTKKYARTYDLYYLRDTNDTVTAFIQCEWRSCSHVFLHDGLVVSFRHNRSDLAGWREMQQRLIVLLDSFVVREDVDGAE